MGTGLYDRAQMSVSGTPGTGTITLGAAITAYQTFTAAGALDQETLTYLAIDGSNWEIGRGVYTAAGTTLTRAQLISSSSGSAISLTSSAIIAIVVSGEDMSLMETLLSQAVNQVVNPGCAVHCGDEYQINAGIQLEIGTGSLMKVG